VITLDDATYAYYAISKPRPYSLVVFLTAAHPKFKCNICKALDAEFQTLASAYAKLVKKEGTEPKVFFLRLDYDSSQQVFQKYEVQSVPMIFFSSPNGGGEGGGSSGGDDKSEYAVSIRDKFQIPPEVEAEAIASFLKDRSGVSVPIQRSQWFAYLSLLVVFVMVSLLLQPIINSHKRLLPLIRNKTLWSLVSAGVYTCAISGLIFDIIRSPQMYYANPQSGQIMFFYPQSGSQFVVEGFIIGFLNLTCAGALIFMTVKATSFKTEQQRTIGLVGGLVVFGLCFMQIRRLYIMKNRWYGSM